MPTSHRQQQPREAQLETYFNDQLRMRTGGRTIKLAPTQRGVPDRLVILPPGFMFLVELKTNVGKLSPIQEFWHQQIAALGISVHVLYGKDQIDSWIRWAQDHIFELHQSQQDVERAQRRREAQRNRTSGIEEAS